MIEAVEAMLEKHSKFVHEPTPCHSFIGADGIMVKSTTMDAFASYAQIDGYKSEKLQEIQILMATSSVKCGISSSVSTIHCTRVVSLHICMNCCKRWIVLIGRRLQ